MSVVYEVLIGSLNFKQPKRDIDDIVDRINHYWCVLILLIFTLFVTCSQVVGDPIHCWCPAEFADAFVDYAEATCWMRNIYYVPLERPIPTDLKERKSAEIQYYRWVPVVLAILAILFKIPNILWNVLSNKADIKLKEVVKLAERTTILSTKARYRFVERVATYTDRLLLHSKKHRPKLKFGGKHIRNHLNFYNKHSGKYLISLYLFIKALYLINVVSQFFLLDAFLHSSFRPMDLFSGVSSRSYRDVSKFPRAVLCDFEIRQLSNIQQWTVQCVITVNLFNERIFEFIWCLLIVMSIVNAVSMGKWLFEIFYSKHRDDSIKRCLKYNQQLSTTQDKKLLRKFICSFLGLDGLLLLKVVSTNSSEIFVGDLTLALWKKYKERNSHPIENGNIDDNEHDEKEKNSTSV